MMNRQMDMFREGGLNQEGGMIDAESGNEVPVGSTREEVRDDIPAKLSEGEFVMPADVVRYHGLDKMMALRDEAKMGLRKMDAMGQMGNSDEATLPEEMPFGMADLIVVAEDGKEVEMAEGGYVTMANGGLTPNNNPLENTRQLGATYRPPTSQPIDFTKVMGDGGISFKQYRNANGENLLVSFIGGVPITPIPEGYTEYTPGADEPVTPIQEVVQLSPPTPVASDEDRQRAGYEEGYSIGIENMTPDQLIEENRRRTSIFGKLAGAVAFAINPAVGAVYAFGVNNNKKKLLEAAKKNNMTELASSIEKEKGIGGLVGGVINILSDIVPESIKNSKLGQIVNAAFNGEGSDPADLVDAKNAVTVETKINRPLRRPTGVPITGGIQPESRADITPAVSGAGGQVSGISSALRGGFDSSRLDRERGILPSGVQVAGNVSNEQLRQFNQNYMTAGDRYAMTMGGRGLRGTRPEGFGDQNLGFVAQDAPAPFQSNMRDRNMTTQGMVDPRDPNMRDRNMTAPGMTAPFESNMRDRNMRPPAAGPTPYYDAFGNTTVFTGRERDRVDTGIPLGTDAAPGFFAYGDRNTQDEIDAATSAYASNAPRPYNDPGAYTFAAPFGRQDAMGQFPSSPITQASSSIPAPTGFNFVEEERDRVRAGQPILDQRDTATQEADRLRELGRLEEARRMQSDRGFIPTNVVGARPDDAVAFDPILQGDRGFRPTNIQTATPDDATRFETPVVDQTQKAFGSLFRDQRADRAAREFASGVGSTGAQISETPVFEPAADPRVPYTPSPIIARADERNLVQPDTRARAMEANARRNAAAEQGTLITQLERPLATDIQKFPEVKSGLRVQEPEISPSLMLPPSTAETQAAMLGAEGTGMTPAESNLRSQRAKLAQEARDADLNYRLQNQREFLAEDARKARTTPRTTANITDSELGSLSAPAGDPFAGSVPQTLPDNLRLIEEAEILDTTKPKTTAKTVNMFGDTVTKGQKGSDAYLTDRAEVAAKEKVYKDKVNSIEFNTRGRDTLLRSGKVVGKNEPQAMYNREQEETGYIGTDSEGYGVGMIAGPGQAGVVVDADGKALKDGPDGRTGKTIYQDSTGVKYTKSTFGKKETLDGKKYTPAKGAKKGDGADRDNDNEADSGKIICTAMNASYGFGSYRQAIWLNYSNKHLTKAHEVGYHTLFLPLVYLAYTKDIKFIRTLLEHGTRRRTADLRAELKGTKRNTLGRFYRTIFEPLCYTVGRIKIALGN